MREFYLLNEKGEKYEFSYKTMTLVSAVDGLGFEKEITYADYLNLYKKLDEVSPVSEISFTLVFLTKYQGFRDFLSFLEGSASFFLYYKSLDWKYIHCEIISLTKKDISGGALTSTLKIEKLSPWYKDVLKEIIIDVEEDEGKIFPFAYPYVYRESYKGVIRITNNGYFDASLYIRIEGEFKNPEIIVYQDGVEISRLRIYYTSSNAILEIDSFQSDQYIKITENGKSFNAYEYQDFTCDNFLFLKRGTFDLEFKPNVEEKTKCLILMKEGYIGN